MFKQYMENVNLQKIIVITSAVIRIVVGGFLVFSAYAKYVSAAYYLKFLTRLGIPYEIADKTVIPLIVFELVFGLLLIAGYRTKIMLRLTSLLFLVFTAVVTYSLIAGIDVSCGCFGPYFKSEINYLSIARNLIITISTFLISFSKRYPFTIDSLLEKRRLKKLS
jgi:putative oxidoreductase